jgi:hypothetical protein
MSILLAVRPRALRGREPWDWSEDRLVGSSGPASRSRATLAAMDQSSMPPLLVLAGATATGKTGLAIDVA